MTVQAVTDRVIKRRARHFVPGDRRARGCRSWRNEDSGQAMLLVLAILAVLILVPVVIARDVDNEFPLLSNQVQTQQAEAAAEAGIQHYRNLLDNIPNYWEYNATNLPQTPLPADPALETTNGTLSGPPVYLPVTAGSVQSYHYDPSTTCITTSACSTGPDNGDVVLLVTGRAGANGRYSFESLTATFKLSGILNDAYYSEYELLDPNVPGSYPMDTTGTYAETAIYPAGTYSQMVMPIASLNNSLFMDLCGYYTYQANTYIDSLGTISDPDPGEKLQRHEPVLRAVLRLGAGGQPEREHAELGNRLRATQGRERQSLEQCAHVRYAVQFALQLQDGRDLRRHRLYQRSALHVWQSGIQRHAADRHRRQEQPQLLLPLGLARIEVEGRRRPDGLLPGGLDRHLRW